MDRAAHCVLVVEDSLLVAMEMEEELLAAGYRVDVAGSLAAADEAIQGRNYAAALLDFQLPDGLALDLALRLDGLGCVVALVTGALPEHLPPGCERFAFFDKPVPPQVLVDWVTQVVERRGAE
ncbi:hypothetical protein OLX02_03870 [Novosphingobium sp. KCTC 2891]|uniref:hypothetical protein n=1 Tax=Novosphingobium sp. KCTC 2891 TaxID=2989730 RepID=UPI002221A465|nr:hypothetical protein [Novosphingobium sp. KCTC 2891]MCW1381952.1 hypothetical protein [Novosphingobium sp. KCTC 2891]